MTTNGFPKPQTFRCEFRQTYEPLYPLNKEETGSILADSLACPLQVVGRGTDCVYYKYLLNDTLYRLQGDSCVPFMYCNLGKEAVRLTSRKNNLKDNARACITGVWETSDYWWIQYRQSIQVKGKNYRFTTLGVLDKNMKCEMSAYLFFIRGQKIYLSSRKTLYMDKEGTRFIQVYNEKDMKEEKREMPFNLQGAPNQDAVLLNYFYIDKLKKKKI